MSKTIITLWILMLLMGFGGVATAASTELSAECTWHAEAGCSASCEGLGFHAECMRERSRPPADVKGCDSIALEAECQASSCGGSCTVECDADPGSFDCEGYCGVDCSAGCSGTCEETITASASASAKCSVLNPGSPPRKSWLSAVL
jgi:hypothetical protein